MIRGWNSALYQESGAYIDSVAQYLRWANNDTGDMDAFFNSVYSEPIVRRLDETIRYGMHPDSKATAAFLEGRGVIRQIYDDETFYGRWSLTMPLAADTRKDSDQKYPLVFLNRAGQDAIERVEYGSGFDEILAQEGFCLCCCQNTDPAFLEKTLDRLVNEFPIDPERVYVTGYSSGGQQTNSAAFAFPEKLTAFAPCGNDIYRNMTLDFHEFTQQEEERLRVAGLPMMMMVGCCEHSNIVPLNEWRPKLFKGGERMYIECPEDPRQAMEQDPTDKTGGKFAAPHPGEGEDPALWEIEQLNRRMDLLGCPRRNPQRCLSYQDYPEDELHHVLGFYGDWERIELHYGYKHYMIDIDNEDGIPVFRYVAVENSPHCQQSAMAAMVWDFFRQFRRDGMTGRVVMDPYQYRQD